MRPKKYAPVRSCVLFLLHTSALSLCAAADPRLPHLFTDHAVLQRGRPVSVWGWADPGERITVRLAGRARKTSAGADGRWRVSLPPLGAGGPYTLSVEGKRTLTVRDVLVGEVWVASGQSNMDFQLSRAQTAAAELPRATSPTLRLIKVPMHSALEPRADFDAAWQTASPESAKDWSAVAYFFARDLQARLKVPVGIIQTTWSGTAAEAWTDAASLASDPDFEPILRRWADAPESEKELARRPAPYSLQFDDFELFSDGTAPALTLSDFDGGALKTAAGGSWTAVLNAGSDFRTVSSGRGDAGRAVAYAGALTASTYAALNASFAADNSPVDLSRYAGLRFSARGRGFFKVRFVQPSITDWDDYATRGFEASPEWRRVTVRFDELRQAGWGVRQPFTPGALKGFAVEILRRRDGGPALPPSSLYNGMVAPLMPYAVRGAIWYQGESNAGRSYQYRKLLPAMIRGWREGWGQGDFPFLVVQLSAYGAGPNPEARSGWAELREAQLLTSKSTPQTGLAVTVDLGEPGNVHPARKAEVGRRLALWALGTTYGQGLVYSGPLYESSRVERGGVRIRFRHVGGGLTTSDGGPPKGFIVAGDDRVFHAARAVVEGDTVVVSSPEVPRPVSVRYAWADSPVCNLVNREGLPASPFRTDDWPGVTADAR